MKKISILALALACMLGVSCQKDPDTDNLDGSYLVYTNYDTDTDFKSINSFYVIDSILIIDNSQKSNYWSCATSTASASQAMKRPRASMMPMLCYNSVT